MAKKSRIGQNQIKRRAGREKEEDGAFPLQEKTGQEKMCLIYNNYYH